VTLTVWLTRPALIRLLVRQEAPVCRVWGTLVRDGDRGLNRLRFRGRIRGKLLPPGTYRIRAEAIRGGDEDSLGAVTVGIAPRSRKVEKVRAPRSTCDSPIAEVTDEEADAANSRLRTGPPEPQGSGNDDPEVAAATAEKPSAGAAAEKVPLADDDASVVGSIPNPFREAPGWLQPLMLVMLVIAIVLLQLGVLPARLIPSSDAALFVARRRPAFLGAGAGLLGALGVAVLTI
jgi:hypothetical protein